MQSVHSRVLSGISHSFPSFVPQFWFPWFDSHFGRQQQSYCLPQVGGQHLSYLAAPGREPAPPHTEASAARTQLWRVCYSSRHNVCM